MSRSFLQGKGVGSSASADKTEKLWATTLFGTNMTFSKGYLSK